MAAITSSAVTLTRSWETVDRAGCVREKVSDLVITLSSQGVTGDIPCAILGFAVINAVISKGYVDGSSTLRGIGVIPDAAGIGLLTIDDTQVTDANRNLPAAITGTLYVRVFGIPHN